MHSAGSLPPSTKIIANRLASSIAAEKIASDWLGR